jgi:glucose-fructose oxidoreductase
MIATSKKDPAAVRDRDQVGYAVVGLGWIAQGAVLPGFAHARKNSRLVALVSGDPVKRQDLGQKYNARAYAYEQYDECLRSEDVDAVYVALPNSMHREYTERAAAAGVHVLCEKPMADTEEECQAMISACRTNGVRLMIAYRLHFDEANLNAIEIIQSGQIGDARAFDSLFCQQVLDPNNIRLKKALGGGTVGDMGVYCINAARYLFRAEPEEVTALTASNGEPRFRQVEEMTGAVLRFPGGRLATFICSFGAEHVSIYHVAGTKGSLTLDPAYSYEKEIQHWLTVDGKTSQKTFPRHDQFGAEIAYFSDCLLKDQEPEPNGEEGLADVRVVQAIYRSAEAGRPVRLPPFERQRRPGPRQEIEKPPVKEPKLLHAATPEGKSK